MPTNDANYNCHIKVLNLFSQSYGVNIILIAVPIENVHEIWPTKMDFGQPNAKIDRKMANGRLLFLALLSH